MLINADHRGWLVATVAATAAAAAGYAWYVAESPYGPSGGSWPGLGFGIAGTVAMVVAGLLGVRKKVRTWRIGSARLWLAMHIWLSVLAVPLILFHAGFRLGGPLTTALMVLFGVVVVSGVFGLVLQQVIPTMMTTRVRAETVTGQIEHVRDGLAADAYELVASVAGPVADAEEERARLRAEEEVQQTRAGYWKAVPRLRPAESPAPESAALREVYLREVRPYLRRAPEAPPTPPDLQPLLLQAPEEWRAVVERLGAICEEARQLAVQERLHTWLHNWLFVHAPLSLALFALTALHVVFALRY